MTPTPLRSGASIFKQGVDVIEVPRDSLMDSPRNFNASVIEFGGERLLAYRSHRMNLDARCDIAMCRLDDRWRGSDNHWIDLQGPTGFQHHEDPRLFVFRGRLHLSYVESTFRGRDPYTCVIRYCSLKRDRRGHWSPDRVYWPKHGLNDGQHREKNWNPFVYDDRLHFLYESDPPVTIEVDGSRIVRVHRCDDGATAWHWGPVRGGTPPLLDGNQYVTFFHSSEKFPVPPYWRRYHMAALTFEAVPPFRITAISRSPILSGSFADGHARDPRGNGVIDGIWKPGVCFAMGAIKSPDGWHVSAGVNDHFTVIAHVKDLKLGCPRWSDWRPRFFYTLNASRPIHVSDGNARNRMVRWTALGKSFGGVPPGVITAHEPRLALAIAEVDGIVEIDQQEHDRLLSHTKDRL